MANSNAAKFLALVEKSPEAVAVHDKNAWLALFAQYHVVEDPVGSTAHVGGIYDGKSGLRGTAKLARFFDTFIAPNKICFEVTKDIVCDTHVLRDLTIHIAMSDKVQVHVPMHLLYELCEEKENWKIQRLAAHWELLPMLGQLFGKGLAAVPVMAALTVRMLCLQGIGGMLGFSKAVCNIGNRGKFAVQQFVDAVNKQSLADLMAVSDSDAALIQWPVGQQAISPSQFLETVSGKLLLMGKCLAAGDTVTANVQWESNGESKQGVLFFEFNRKTKKISQLRGYF